MSMTPATFGDASSDGQASPEQETQTESHSLLPDYLKNIPEQDRLIVSKYTKDWDAGVTKRFQSIHDEYKGKLKPYQDLGYDPDTLSRMVQFVDLVNQDPARAYQALAEVIQGNNPEIWEQLQNGEEMSDDGQELGDGGEDYGGLDPAIQQLIEQQNQQIAELTQWRDQFTQSQIEEEQFAQFDTELDGVLQKYGIEGDDARDHVTVLIARGASLEDAAKQYNNFVNGLRNSQNARPVPNIIGGQGGVPSDQVDASKLRGNDRQNFIAQYLASKQG